MHVFGLVIEQDLYDGFVRHSHHSDPIYIQVILICYPNNMIRLSLLLTGVSMLPYNAMGTSFIHHILYICLTIIQNSQIITVMMVTYYFLELMMFARLFISPSLIFFSI